MTDKELHKKQLMCLSQEQLVEMILLLEKHNEEWIVKCRKITEQWGEAINNFKKL